MKITEFRIPMPFSLDEYEVGKLFSVNKASLLHTGGGEGVECLANTTYKDIDLFGNGKITSGQYTKKIYYIRDQVPTILRGLAPHGSMEIMEESWNAFPYTKTVATNPGYMKEKFYIQVDTIHLNDRGESQNVHGLSADDLERRQVVKINIAADSVDNKDYNSEEDPKKFKPKTENSSERGPLAEDWLNRAHPVMTAYKLVRVKFSWKGFQSITENYLIGLQKRMFTLFNRRIYCWMDEWLSMDMPAVREYESSVNNKLVKKRKEQSKDVNMQLWASKCDCLTISMFLSTLLVLTSSLFLLG